jgi:hypothetical protein
MPGMSDQPPRIVLPDGFRDKSGLYLPTDLATVSAKVDIPAELQPRIDLIVAGRLPAFVDQVIAYGTEAELGFDPTPPDDIVAITREIPFWPSMRFLSRFQRDLWNVRLDQDAQAVQLERWFAGSAFAERAEAWMRQDPQRVLFSEQQLFALQRLIVLNGRDGPVEAVHTDEEYVALVAALVAIPGSLLNLAFDFADEPTPVDDERWMRFFVGHGGFIGRGALRNELGRANRLYGQIAESPAARSHHAYCPLDEWLVEEYGLRFEELQAFAFALQAGSKMAETEELPSLVDASYFQPTILVEKAPAALEALSAPRDWYVGRFAGTQTDARRAVLESIPFLQRPALRQPDGKVMPIAPRALEAWMGTTGNYYRYFDLARDKGSATRKRFTTFNGWIVETYVCETLERAYPAKPNSGIWLPGGVHRDLAYPARGGERRTPDVAIDLTPDLILVEVTGSRLTEKSVIDADPEAVRADIQKVLIDKIEQLGDRIEDLRESVATLPGVRIDQIDRIWPIIVSSEGLFQTPTLWAYIRPAVEGALAQPKVQPLTLFDIEDLEELMGLVAAGHSAVDILRDKTSQQWRELEFSVWFWGSGGRTYSDDSPLARQQFEEATDSAVRELFGSEAVAERSRLSASDS